MFVELTSPSWPTGIAPLTGLCFMMTVCWFLAGCVSVCLAPQVSVCDQLRAASQAISLRSLLQLSPAEESDAPKKLLTLKSPCESDAASQGFMQTLGGCPSNNDESGTVIVDRKRMATVTVKGIAFQS